MRVTWILEPDMCAAYCDSLVDEIAAQGHAVRTIPSHYTRLDWGDTARFYQDFSPQGSCVVCHASFEFALQVAADELWIPGTYGMGEASDCSRYFPHYDDCLLNSDYEIVSLGDLAHRADALFQTFSVDQRIFIRPDSGRKTFVGRLFTRTELDVEMLRSMSISRKTLAIVSRPKSIRREWRFVIADHSVVAASLYKDQGSVRLSSDVPHAAWDFASVVAARPFQPDRVWMLDTCELANGEMKVVEINGFSSANWYACNVKDIVAAVSRVAIDDWKRSMPTTSAL